MVPVQATGFKDLKLRIEEQDKTTALQQKALHVHHLSYAIFLAHHRSLVSFQDMQQYIHQLQQKHDLDTKMKLEHYRRTHRELAQRLIRVYIIPSDDGV